jgi:phenylacetate-CoA ligase
MDASPLDFNCRKDLSCFPILNKEKIRKHFDLLQNPSCPVHKKFFVRTGGTTGTPMTFYQSRNVWKKELAFVNHFFARYGYTPGQLKVSFKGGAYETEGTKHYMHQDPASNTILLSPLHLNRHTIFQYVHILNRYQIRFFHTYPSTLLLFIRQMLDNGLTLKYRPQAVFLASEGYDQEDILLIKDFFNCPVSSFYGHSERLLFAMDIPDSDLQYFRPDKRYGLMELIDSEHRVITKAGEKGTMVGTSFDNWAMPLIRYETDDTTCYLDKEMRTISKIESLRNKIYLDAKQGEKISITFLSISSLSDHILAFQFLQKQKGHLELRIIPSTAFTNADEKKITHILEKKIGHKMDIEVSLVSKLTRTERGKILNLVKTY